MSTSLFSGSTPADWREADPDSAYREQCRGHFEALVGGEFDYYGADGAEYEFKIDSIVFKVLEDPQDGYRSCLGAIEYSADQSRGIFFRAPLARVKLVNYDRDAGYGDNDHGYALVDIADGHVWLEFGTDHYNDYYPMFAFRHHPKMP